MNKYTLLTISMALLMLAGCVQKSSKKTVVVKLNVAGMKDIQTVGMRGSEKPLSWRNDLEMNPIVKDSLYTVTFSLVTGYTFTEAKFTVNGNMELQEKENRRIDFSNGDTTVYEATFEVVKE